MSSFASRLSRLSRRGTAAARPAVPPLALLLLLAPFAAPAKADTFSFRTLAEFSNSRVLGASPIGGVVVDKFGTVYGTASVGGAFDHGTLWEIVANSGMITPIASFTGAAGAVPGDNPRTDLIFGTDGNIYGAASAGGANGTGTVFRLNVATNVVDQLAAFTPTAGQFPSGGPTFDAAGNLFGTTSAGGPAASGTVWELPSGTSTVHTVGLFDGTTTGAGPRGSLTPDGAGGYYGVTASGGASGFGTVFHFDPLTGAVDVVASFDGTNGRQPTAVTTNAAGDLFGTTTFGGAFDSGTVFAIPHGTSGIQTLVDFNSTNGNRPNAGVTIDADGNLFGTTAGGGAHAYGTIWEIEAGAGSLQTIFDFDGFHAAGPNSTLFLDGAGNLYGTTIAPTFDPPQGGGLVLFEPSGTVFELTRVGATQQPPDVPEPGAVATGLTLFGATGLGILRGRLARRRPAAAI